MIGNELKHWVCKLTNETSPLKIVFTKIGLEGLIKEINVNSTDSSYGVIIKTFKLNFIKKEKIKKIIISTGLDSFINYSDFRNEMSIHLSNISHLNSVLKELSSIEKLDDLINNINEILNYTPPEINLLPVWVEEKINHEMSTILHELVFYNTIPEHPFNEITLITYHSGTYQLILKSRKKEDNEKLQNFINQTSFQSLVKFENINEFLLRLNTQHSYLILQLIKTINSNCLNEIIDKLGKYLKVNTPQVVDIPRWITEKVINIDNSTQSVDYYNTNKTDVIEKIRIYRYFNNGFSVFLFFRQENDNTHCLKQLSSYNKTRNGFEFKTGMKCLRFFIEKIDLITECYVVINDMDKILNVNRLVSNRNWIKYNHIETNNFFLININKSKLLNIYAIVMQDSQKIRLEIEGLNWKEIIPAIAYLPFKVRVVNEKSIVTFKTDNPKKMSYILSSLENFCGPTVDDIDYSLFNIVKTSHVVPPISALFEAYQEKPELSLLEQICHSIESKDDLLLVCPKTNNSLLEILLKASVEDEKNVLKKILDKDIISPNLVLILKKITKITQDTYSKQNNLYGFSTSTIVDDIITKYCECSSVSIPTLLVELYFNSPKIIYEVIFAQLYVQGLLNFNDIADKYKIEATHMLFSYFVKNDALLQDGNLINNVKMILSKEALDWNYSTYKADMLRLLTKMALKNHTVFLEEAFNKNMISQMLLEETLFFESSTRKPILHVLLEKLPIFYSKALDQKLITSSMLQQKNNQGGSLVDLLLEALQNKQNEEKLFFFKTYAQGLIKPDHINQKYNTLIFLNQEGQLVFNPDFYIQNPEEEVLLLELLGQEDNVGLKLLGNLFINFEVIAPEWKIRLEFIDQLLLNLSNSNEISTSYYQEKLLNIYGTLKTLGIDRTMHQLKLLRDNNLCLNYFDSIKNLDTSVCYYKQACVDFSNYILSIEKIYPDEYLNQSLLQQNRYYCIKIMLQLLDNAKANLVEFNATDLKLLMQSVIRYVLGDAQEISEDNVKIFNVFNREIYSNKNTLLLLLNVIENINKKKKTSSDKNQFKVVDYINSLQFKEQQLKNPDEQKELEKWSRAFLLKDKIIPQCVMLHNIDLELNILHNIIVNPELINSLTNQDDIQTKLTHLADEYFKKKTEVESEILSLEKLLDDKLIPLSNAFKKLGHNVYQELAYLFWNLNESLFNFYIESFIQTMPEAKILVIQSNSCEKLAYYLLANASVNDLDNWGKTIKKKGREERLKMALTLALSLDKVEYSEIKTKLCYHIAAVLVTDQAPLSLSQEKTLFKLLNLMTDKDASLCIYLLEHFYEWNEVYSELLNNQEINKNDETIQVQVGYHILYRKGRCEDEDTRQAKRFKF